MGVGIGWMIFGIAAVLGQGRRMVHIRPAFSIFFQRSQQRLTGCTAFGSIHDAAEPRMRRRNFGKQHHVGLVNARVQRYLRLFGAWLALIEKVGNGGVMRRGG